MSTTVYKEEKYINPSTTKIGITNAYSGPNVTSIVGNYISKTGDSATGNFTFTSGTVSIATLKLPTGASAGKFLTSDADGDASWATITGVITGLTTNYVTKATSATSIGNSVIYNDGTKVGINTTSTDAILGIKGDGVVGAWGESYNITNWMSSGTDVTGFFRDYATGQKGIIRMMNTAGEAVTDGYTILSIDGPADNPREATLGLVLGYGEVVDLFHMKYDDAVHWGFRYTRGLAAGVWKDFIIESRNLFSGSIIKRFTITMPDGHIYTTANIGTESFVSGFAGSGWQNTLDSGDYTLTVDNLYVRKSMNVYELIINQIRATNGSIWVSDCTKITGVSSWISGITYYLCTIDTDGGNILQPFDVGDIIRCQKWTGRTIKYYTAIVDAVGSTNEDFTVHVANGTDYPEIGDDVVRVGNSSDTDRQGSIYLTASDSNAPYIDILGGVSTYSFANCTKVRLGNLEGITDTTYGALTGYGLWCGVGYIGGWKINDNYLAKDTGTDATSMGLAPADYPFYAGATYANRASAVYRVTSAGELYCSKATIKSASTGKRIELSAANNNLFLYAASGTDYYVMLDANYNAPYISIVDDSGGSSTYTATSMSTTLSGKEFSAIVSTTYLEITILGLQGTSAGSSWKNLVVNPSTGEVQYIT